MSHPLDAFALFTLRELIFARTNFREWSNFGDFARTNFRE